MAQPMAHHFGSISTHVHGAPKLSEHLVGQQSPGDKVVALDQVHYWTANLTTGPIMMEPAMLWSMTVVSRMTAYMSI